MNMPIVAPEGAIQLPIEPAGSFSHDRWADCGECTAVCCSAGVVMALTEQEADYLTAAGTILSAVAPEASSSWKRRSSKETKYQFETDCANLVRTEEGGPGVCAAFTESDRPAICASFKVGSYACKTMQFQAGVITDAEFVRYYNATSM